MGCRDYKAETRLSAAADFKNTHLRHTPSSYKCNDFRQRRKSNVYVFLSLQLRKKDSHQLTNKTFFCFSDQSFTSILFSSGGIGSWARLTSCFPVVLGCSWGSSMRCRSVVFPFGEVYFHPIPGDKELRKWTSLQLLLPVTAHKRTDFDLSMWVSS